MSEREVDEIYPYNMQHQSQHVFYSVMKYYIILGQNLK